MCNSSQRKLWYSQQQKSGKQWYDAKDHLNQMTEVFAYLLQNGHR